MYKLFLSMLMMSIIISCGNESSEKLSENKFYQNHNKFLEKNSQKSKIILDKNFKFDGIEFIYVDLGPVYYSWWGHTVIRFVNSGATPSEDITVDFIADFYEYNLDNWKGYFGGYEVLPQIRQLKDLIDDYTIKEKRFLARYILPIDDEIKINLLNKLRDWIVNPENAGTYTFRENNCSGILLKWLHQSGFELTSDYTYFPFDIPNELRIRKVVKTPPLYVHSEKDDLKAVDQILYRRCQSSDCKNEKINSAYSVWGQEKVDSFFNIKKNSTKVKHDVVIKRLFQWFVDLNKMNERKN